jgi:hypothetical protein
VLLVVECLLWLSERLGAGWHKGYAVLTAVAAAGVAMLLMGQWLAIALVSRRRFQFSIRSLLVLSVAVAILSSWFAVKMKEAKRQQKAIEAILKSGGAVTYDYEYDWPSRAPQNAKPPGPAWLRNLLGGDFLDRVTEVRLIGDDDAELEPLEALPELRQLLVFPRNDNGSKITDAGLARLESLPRLTTLWIWGPNITDAGLAHLEHLHQLADLHLGGANITDAGLTHLENLHELEALNLHLVGDRITDAGLVHFQSLRKLKKLRLHHAISDECITVSDDAMMVLMSLKHLRDLRSCVALNDRVKERVYNALQSPTLLDFEYTPLVEVCEYLQDFHAIKIEFDDTALKDANIDKSCEVTCNYKKVTLRAGLDLLLDPLGLAWHVGSRGVVVTTKAVYAKRHLNLLRLKQALPNLKEVEVDW